jgi:nucleotide-binding universal stress UspA family protein
MVLICYDGSPDARAAIEQGARLLEGEEATVLTVWEPFIEVVAHTPAGWGLMPGIVDAEKIDEAARRSAEARAAEGAQLAGAAGLRAEPRACAQETTTAETILNEAQTAGANAILIGSRGLTGLKSVLLGSVSQALIHHADVPVIVVPSPEVATARKQDRAAHRPG